MRLPLYIKGQWAIRVIRPHQTLVKTKSVFEKFKNFKVENLEHELATLTNQIIVSSGLQSWMFLKILIWL